MPTVECKCWDYGTIWQINILFFPQNSLVWYSLYVSIYFVAIIRSRDSIVVMTRLRAGRPKKYSQLEQGISFPQRLDLLWGLNGFLFDGQRLAVGSGSKLTGFKTAATCSWLLRQNADTFEEEKYLSSAGNQTNSILHCIKYTDNAIQGRFYPGVREVAFTLLKATPCCLRTPSAWWIEKTEIKRQPDFRSWDISSYGAHLMGTVVLYLT
jgi:hypothetical protein